MNQPCHDEFPAISGNEAPINEAIARSRGQSLYASESRVDFGRVKSACAIALHMHQPMIPAGHGGSLQDAKIISNLEYMLQNPGTGDNHNASVFHWCYKRIGEFIPEMVDQGLQPRAMLDYSGTLFHGLKQMGLNDVFDALRRITCEARYRHCVEWLLTPWGHAVAPSTPIQDYRLHLAAWQQHFADLFGVEALARVRGFSPSEMALPNHPDLAYEFVKALKDHGLEWILVQEHTVELPENGATPGRKHIPYRLVCRNSEGREASIVALIKTQGSDTKLVAQMQPWYEAAGLGRVEMAGKMIPQLVSQIADGENGGVMMNEFPSKYKEVVRTASGGETPLLNGSEYLEFLAGLGIKESDFPVIQPIFQKRIWERFKAGEGAERLEQVVAELKKEDNRFHVEGGSWTNNISWVRGYENVLGPMEKVSSLFNEKVLKQGLAPSDGRYRRALYYLLLSQTSCYRYWGQGIWADYGREICRRAEEILTREL